jgi:NhaP-type Na+/H+ or K+/H+ antiporter
MTITVGLVALAGVTLLSLPLGAAVLLGAVLAPTDPVLASDVQVEHPTDRDRLRFGLTGEAGLNDGTAFPFVLLGLGLLGLHDLGPFGWRWVAIEVLWAGLAGLGIGAVLGTLVGRLVLFLRREHREAVGWDDFLALGLIALAYGAALLVHAYGFLAVFAAGLALRRVESHAGETSADSLPEPEQVMREAARTSGQSGQSGQTEPASPALATNPATAPAYMAQAVLGFNQQLERITEVAVVLTLGALLTRPMLSPHVLWFAPLLFLVIRPLAVAVGLFGTRTAPQQFVLLAWFGIRGVGSLYYLMYALQHGLADASADLAREVTALTLCVIAVSVVVHGISVTPLMTRYARWQERRVARPAGGATAWWRRITR